MHKALFLDRDGIVNVDKGYVHRWEDIVWVPEIFEIIKMANEKNYKVIILTNQSGIHKGMYTKEDVHVLHQKMHDFLKEKKLTVDDWFYCAEMDSEFRKPRPGMLLAAQKKHDIDLSKSFMVGDKATDVFIADGKFTRPETILVRGGYDIHHEDIGKNVRICENHADLLKLLSTLL